MQRPRLPSRLKHEAGFGLIEVIVSSTLLALVTLGVLAGIDGATTISAQSQNRATATSIAQQDQARMRGMTATDLSDLNQTRQVTVDRLAYTVTSTATWTTDSGGTISCQSNSSSSNYMILMTRVSWRNQGTTGPVTSESIYTPPVGRSGYIVQLLDHSNNPVPDIPVTLSNGLVRRTNSIGCAFFGNLRADSYGVSYSEAGFINQSMVQDVTVAPQTVAAGQNLVHVGTYARAANPVVNFRTTRNGDSNFASTAVSVSALNSSAPATTDPVGTRRAFSSPVNTSVSSLSLKLFPYSNGYSVYAGSCAGQKPTIHSTLAAATSTGATSFTLAAGPVPAAGASVVLENASATRRESVTVLSVSGQVVTTTAPMTRAHNSGGTAEWDGPTTTVATAPGSANAATIVLPSLNLIVTRENRATLNQNANGTTTPVTTIRVNAGHPVPAVNDTIVVAGSTTANNETVTVTAVAAPTTAGQVITVSPALTKSHNSGSAVTWGSADGTPMAGGRVTFTASASGCTDKITRTTTTFSTGDVTNLNDPGIPWGTYTICADDAAAVTARGGTQARRVSVANIVIGSAGATTPAAQGATTAGTWRIPPTGGTTGACP